MAKTSKLRPSKAVFERMRWDPGFDTAGVVVVYTDRFQGPRERDFASFNPERIPFSRVIQFRRGDQILWDRATRLDRVFGSGNTAPDQVLGRDLRGPAPSPLAAGDVTRWKPRRFDPQAGEWVEDEPTAAAATSATILTFNVLHDLYDEGQLESARRLPVLLDALREHDADIIGLQEVTPGLASVLLAQDWVRQRYAVSLNEDLESVTPYGIAILSRLSLGELTLLRSGPRAYALLAPVPCAQLRLAVVHLTSDRHELAPTIRREQIRCVLRELDNHRTGSRAARVLAGDFNFGDEHDEPLLRQAGLRDVWAERHPDAPGFTFDPEENAVAAVNSLSMQRRRLDRVFVSDVDVADTSIALFKPRSGDASLPASDHEGLAFELRCLPRGHAVRELAPTHRTAVVLLPPARNWHRLQALRRERDRSFVRWMPHINLLYGFVPEAHFAEAAPIIAEALADVAPFNVTLSRLRHFRHHKSDTLWMEPECDRSGALDDLHRRLESAFPRCTEQGRKSEAGFTPHLTVGQLRGADRDQLEAMIEGWSARLTAETFVAGSVALISRRGDEPFEVRRVIAFGGSSFEAASRWPPAASEVASSAEARDGVATALDDPVATVHIVGSARYLDDVTSSCDVDLVVRGDSAPTLETIAASMRAAPRIESVRLVFDAVVPAVRARVGGREVDITRAAVPAASESDVRGEAAIALAGWLETRLEVHGAGLRSLLSRLRLWAARRDIDRHALGFPGAAAWAVLACDAYGASRSTGALRFLDTLVTIEERCGAGVLEKLRSPVPPHALLVRGASVPAATVVRTELERAIELVRSAARGEAPWSSIFEPVDRWQHERYVAVELSGAPAHLEQASGWLWARAQRVVRSLAADGAWVRPYRVLGVAPTTVALVCGCEPTASALERVRGAVTSDFEASDGPSNARLSVESASRSEALERWAWPGQTPLATGG